VFDSNSWYFIDHSDFSVPNTVSQNCTCPTVVRKIRVAVSSFGNTVPSIRLEKSKCFSIRMDSYCA